MKKHVVGPTPLGKRKLRRLVGGWTSLFLAASVIALVAATGYLTNQSSVQSARSADLNGDGRVDVTDLSLVLSGWQTARADINGDGTTNLVDLSMLLSQWGLVAATPTPTPTATRAPTPTATPTPKPTATPTPAPTSPSGEAMPVGNLPGWKQTLAQDFTATATSGTAAGSFKTVYAGSWCGYNEAQGGYYNNEVLSAHGGLMDFTLDGSKGAAGSFGVGGTCGQTYGRFSIRFKAVGATSYGTAMMVWPNSNTWGDGEVDYPEGNFGSTFAINQHGVGCTNCSAADHYNTNTTFVNWHTATTEWTPTGVKYYLDGALIKTTTHDIPINNHRMTIQMAPTGSSATTGHFLIDWVSIYAYNP